MLIDPIVCDEKDLAIFCFENITKTPNNPEIDRKTSNLITNTLINKKSTSKSTLDTPLKILWKVTGRCNSNCVHCWAKLGGEPSTESVLSVAEQICENNVLMVSISGGEAFLRKDLFDIIKKLKSHNVIIDIMSNGSLIDIEVANKLANILDLEKDIVQISLDGSNANIHDKQRNNKIFDKTIQGIKNLRNCGIKVRNVFTATTINQDDLLNTYKLAGELGVQTFAPAPVFPLRKGKAFENNLNSLAYIRQVAACKAIEESVGTKLRIQVDQTYQYLINKYYEFMDTDNIIWDKDKIIHMNETNAFMQIDAVGEVLPGPEWENNASAGNVYKEGLMNIWNKGKNWEEFRCGRNLTGTPCNGCNVYGLCQGGNAKLAYDKYGTINMPDGSCLIAGRE